MSKKGVILLGSGLVLILLVAGGGFMLTKRHDITRSLERATLPQEINYQEIQDAPTTPLAVPAAATTKPTTAPVPAAAQINLAIPFTSQAPHGIWNDPYKEFCEEASVLMAVRYLKNEPIPNADAAAQAMLEIQAFEQKEFGYWQDTTAEEVAQILTKHFGIKNVTLKVDPTVADIKEALVAGKPVIVPAAGRLLGNPFYTAPGPLYHMLVIKGYTTNDQFITHDPGTRRGADFLYKTSIIMNAMHDWRPDGNIEQGRKVILIVG